MSPADVERIAKPLSVVGADIEQDRQRRGGVDAAAGRVEREFANWDSHAAGPLIAQAQNALPVRDNDHLDAGRGRVLQDCADLAAFSV